MHQSNAPFRRFVPCLFSLTLVACGDDGVEATSASEAATEAPVKVERLVDRVESEALSDLRRNLDLGLREAALGPLKALDPDGTDPLGLGVELDLLAARLACLDGWDMKVTPIIEAARAAAPEDPRVYATAAELHAASGRLETAREELRRGLEACGMSPELLRAQGVVELCRARGARQGLDLLERALSYDPDLPFTLRPRAQAHLLLGKEALAEQRPKAALEHVRHSLELDASEHDTRLLFADVLAANGDLTSAVHVLEELVSDGADRETELTLMYKRAAIGELILRKRSAALEYFRLARAGGLEDDELGSGADMLHDAALASMEDGVTAFAAADMAVAREHFERALAYEPGLLVVHSQLAAVLYQQRKFLPAATHWRVVLDTALLEDIELPDPTHIFLAKALYAAGEKQAAKMPLLDYLEREPDGKYADATRALVAEL